MPAVVSRIPALAIGTTVAAAAVFGASLSQPEDVIGRSFASAFERQEPRLPGFLRGRDRVALDPALLHLTNHPAVGQAVRLGDRISFSAADGAVRAYTVVDVHPLWTDTGTSTGPRLQLVTARTGNGIEPAAVVRFIVEAGDGIPASPPKPHAL